jgi:hypothetical protein
MEIGLKLPDASDFEPTNELVCRKLVMGSLIYLTATEPDLSFVISYISRLMITPKVDHWMATKRILRCEGYLRVWHLVWQKRGFPTYRYYRFRLVGSIDYRKST